MTKPLRPLLKTVLSAAFICCGPLLAAEHLSDHEEFCRSAETTPCLTLLTQQLAKEPLHSSHWYKLKSYQLDYLYDKLQFTELLQQTEALLQIEQLPVVFRTQVYFYHAKMLKAVGRVDEARHYAELAYQQLSSMHQAFADPLRVLELANLKAVFGEHDKAWILLLGAESRFGRSKDPVFGFELHSNKAIIHHAKGQFEDAAYDRKLALDAILPSGQDGKIIVAYGNLARTYQLLGRYGLAIRYYELSLPHMKPGLDDAQHASHMLRLAELYLQLQDPVNAQRYLHQVEVAKLWHSHVTLYHSLQAQLRAAKPE